MWSDRDLAHIAEMRKFDPMLAMYDAPPSREFSWDNTDEARPSLETRVGALEDRIDDLMAGRCPYCGQVIRGWIPPEHWDLPKLERTVLENIDSATGHKRDCPHKELHL